jgi:hypothetical protein
MQGLGCGEGGEVAGFNKEGFGLPPACGSI